jgi:hypothetical protein
LDDQNQKANKDVLDEEKPEQTSRNHPGVDGGNPVVAFFVCPFRCPFPNLVGERFHCFSRMFGKRKNIHINIRSKQHG